MELKKKISEFIKNKNNRIIFIILIIGTLFMLMPGSTKKTREKTVVTEIEENEGERLEALLSQINGVERVEVMVTYSGTSEKILAYETKAGKTDRGDSGYEENTDEQAVMSEGAPVILSTVYPKVKGVVVIAEGAQNANVKADILEAVTTALDIPSHKVCVLER